MTSLSPRLLVEPPSGWALAALGALALAACATPPPPPSPAAGIGPVSAAAASLPMVAETAAVDVEQELDELIDAAFVRQALREAPEIVSDGVLRIGADLNLHPERERRIAPALGKHFTEAQLLAEFRARVQGELDPALIHEMALGLRTQPVQRMNELGLNANHAPPEELFRYLKGLEDDPPTSRRVEAVQRLVQRYSGAKLTIALIAAPLVSVSEILAASVSTDEEAAMVRALHRAAMQEIGLDQMTPEVMEAALIFAFRDVSDDELVAFADFFASDLGQRYHLTMVKLFFETMQATTEATMRDIRAGTKNLEAPPAPDDDDDENNVDHRAPVLTL